VTVRNPQAGQKFYYKNGSQTAEGPLETLGFMRRGMQCTGQHQHTHMALSTSHLPTQHTRSQPALEPHSVGAARSLYMSDPLRTFTPPQSTRQRRP